MVGGSLVMPVFLGKIMAAIATGKPGAIGEVISQASVLAAEPGGRLLGTTLPTDE